MRLIKLASLLALLLQAASILAAAQPLVQGADPKRLKVVSWNVLYGFDHGRAVGAGADWIARQQADVLALQELNGFDADELRAVARRYGHEFSALQKEQGFAMGLTSTAPIEVLERRVKGFHHGYLHCRTHGIEFFVVHFWPGKEHEVTAVIKKAVALVQAGSPVVVLGDFNSHSAHDASSLASRAFEPRYDVIAGMEDAGFVDLVHRFDRLVSHSFPSPITIPRWSKDRTELESKRQRIDFVFADSVLANHARAATINHSAAIDRISDHYPVIAEFVWPPPPKGTATAVRFAFGVIADCQYCTEKPRGARHYEDSSTKLRACVDHLNELDLAHVLHMGDFIDRDFDNFAVVGPIFEALDCATYHVLGNHDYFVADEHKAAVPKALGMSARYYDFSAEGWRFVVIDGNDISIHATASGSPARTAALEHRQEHAPDAPTWNGAVGPKQLAWLEDVLSRADKAEEAVVICCHYPAFPDSDHNLWNDHEVLTVIDRHKSVKAYISGHQHAGNYAQQDGVHYLTLKALVDSRSTAYAVIEVHPDHLRVLGFGREHDRVLRIR